MDGAGSVLIVFISVGLPVLLGIGLAYAGLLSRQKQLEMMMKERQALIERGVTDLPPLVLPTVMGRRFGMRSLAGGVILLAVAVGLWLPTQLWQGGDQFRVDPRAITICGAIGLALIVIHFIGRAYERTEARDGAERRRMAPTDRPGGPEGQA